MPELHHLHMRAWVTGQTCGLTDSSSQGLHEDACHRWCGAAAGACGIACFVLALYLERPSCGLENASYQGIAPPTPPHPTHPTPPHPHDQGLAAAVERRGGKIYEGTKAWSVGEICCYIVEQQLGLSCWRSSLVSCGLLHS